jgi:hypothetical protein
MPRRQGFHSQLSVAADDEQQVVEIMSNARSQLANRIHFLDMKDFRLQAFGIADSAFVRHRFLTDASSASCPAGLGCQLPLDISVKNVGG